MSIISEQQLSRWAQPPSQTEINRCQNAESMIRKAVNASDALSKRTIRVFAQGSYANRTNVRQDSDVDVAVLCSDTFFYDLPAEATVADFGIQPETYPYHQFRQELHGALVDYFGGSAVSPGNKAFDIKANSYRVEADVAPFFELLHYQGVGQSPLKGVELRPANKSFERIRNWPEQHYDNGVAKNAATGRRYKALVRILKRLAYEMANAGVPEARPIPGFLCECLIWNVPNELFGASEYRDDLKSALFFLFKKTETIDKCVDWGEVSEHKYLFGHHQKWTQQQANDFILAAYRYCGFK
ncbi:MAG: nucleotidyltransferase [Alphaproteobacteria bacterium]|nr:nucleotidyltransferase [Alphaproteobacteria bacterium]